MSLPERTSAIRAVMRSRVPAVWTVPRARRQAGAGATSAPSGYPCRGSGARFPATSHRPARASPVALPGTPRARGRSQAPATRVRSARTGPPLRSRRHPDLVARSVPEHRTASRPGARPVPTGRTGPHDPNPAAATTRGRGHGGRFDPNLGHETVSAARDCLDVAGLFRLVAECLPEQRDVARQSHLLHRRSGPYLAHQFGFVDDTARALREVRGGDR
jgi:hypothetical protein